MELKEFDIDIISTLLTVAAYLISPILFIWSVNTLFECGIDLSFKTWLAGFVLIMLFKFHLAGATGSGEPYYEYDEDDMTDKAENEEEEADNESHRRQGRGKLIPYQDHKNRKKTPPDGTL